MVRDFYRKFDTVFLLFILFDSSISLGMVYGQSASERRLELPNQITYQLETVWVRKIKDGNVIEEKAGPLEFLDEPYKYVIESLNTRKPVLKKFVGKDLGLTNKLLFWRAIITMMKS